MIAVGDYTFYIDPDRAEGKRIQALSYVRNARGNLLPYFPRAQNAADVWVKDLFGSRVQLADDWGRHQRFGRGPDGKSVEVELRGNLVLLHGRKAVGGTPWRLEWCGKVHEVLGPALLAGRLEGHVELHLGERPSDFGFRRLHNWSVECVAQMVDFEPVEEGAEA